MLPRGSWSPRRGEQGGCGERGPPPNAQAHPRGAGLAPGQVALLGQPRSGGHPGGCRAPGLSAKSAPPPLSSRVAPGQPSLTQPQPGGPCAPRPVVRGAGPTSGRGGGAGPGRSATRAGGSDRRPGGPSPGRPGPGAPRGLAPRPSRPAVPPPAASRPAPPSPRPQPRAPPSRPVVPLPAASRPALPPRRPPPAASRPAPPAPPPAQAPPRPVPASRGAWARRSSRWEAARAPAAAPAPPPRAPDGPAPAPVARPPPRDLLRARGFGRPRGRRDPGQEGQHVRRPRPWGCPVSWVRSPAAPQPRSPAPPAPPAPPWAAASSPRPGSALGRPPRGAGPGPDPTRAVLPGLPAEESLLDSSPVVMGSPEGRFHFAIDRGGTFTDVFAQCPGGHVRVLKLLSEDPANYADAPTEGIRRILEQEGGMLLPRDRPLDTSRIASIRMGTTVATNALLERRGERVALLVTRGFRDLLHVGTQAREDLFDLAVPMPEVLYEDVLEVDERVVLYRGEPGSGAPVKGRTGDLLELQQPVDLGGLRAKLEGLLSRGIRSLAVVLMHSYTWAQHEQQVGALARELGFTHVSLSSEAMPMVRIVPRGHTACADAYLTPAIQRYVQGFRRGFQGQLKDVQVLFMRSDGGLAPMDSFSGSRAVLSGPAGGVVGYSATTYQAEGGQPVIGFDMGGTSTDVSRYAGEFEHVFEASTAGVTLQAPQLDINTVAAGGGSRLFFRSGLFVVGPESAGAHPGPACYRKGGPVTVTDANLVLGRLLPASFPCIFGPGEDQPLSPEASRKALEAVATEVNSFLTNGPCPASPLSLEEVAMGFVRVANEAMCRPIRALTQARGHDPSAHVLACFGGAGGQHACAIARALGMDTVHIHRHSGLLSALGLALADVVHEAQEPCSLPYAPETFVQLDQRLSRLEEQCVDTLLAQGFPRSQISTESFLHLRYQGTDCALMVSAHQHPATAHSPRAGDFGAAFVERYMREFGFIIPERPVVVDDVRVRGTGRSGLRLEDVPKAQSGPPRVDKMTQCYFEGGYQETPVYLLGELCSGHKLQGPCLIIDSNSTILVEPGCQAEVTETGDIRISVGAEAPSTVGAQLDPIHLSIFSHRFMSIAEQMGRILQRTAISTNIKERLDFSCALFGPDGGLVSNAPHIPVHLGAMQETVQFQIQHLGADLHPGDVLLSNHPSAGGSHLPDLTVITPVFWPGQTRPVFYVASRGHHADIGGITPGSMPPHSTTLQQEGAVFLSFKLVQGGVFQEDAVTEALRAPGKIPGCSGTRNLHDNLSDLRAQVAANQKGIQLVGELIGQYGLDVVQAYMGHIQANAELAVRDMLRAFGSSRQARGLPLEVSAEDHMDDGSPIRLRVQINLSQGCLAPVRVVIPRGSILDPTPEAAVVGGNVLTSQRVVDVILGAFGACAASQGCMNNVTLGNAHMGYYETVAGGAGAGPGWHGRSGVHSHMTNTRITDPEILESRYPVIVRRFELRLGSGGRGRFRGGDGVIRELLFREEALLSVLTERRAFQPYGLHGGEPGARGLNLLIRKDGRTVNLGGKTSVPVFPGDVFCLHTPGGGGYGDPEDPVPPSGSPQHIPAFLERGSVYEYRRAQEAV
uniref:5-oxoprolinase, ATP-hydrolysing n=1 Tax=Canis lupus familiaris TaxID=9615 RepID=A0A8P0TI97_CANLF